MVVQHNLTALNANRNLNVTTGAQAKSTQKLSSGYKINSAADDAAGLSISEKMRRQVRGLTQAAANAQDGISCVQTAEGALGEVTDMLQRMGELAVKGENDTLKEADRVDIKNEVKKLMEEIDRVASTTTFNDQNLLDGTFSGKSLQVGAEAGQHINISITAMNMGSFIEHAGTDDDQTWNNDTGTMAHLGANVVYDGGTKMNQTRAADVVKIFTGKDPNTSHPSSLKEGAEKDGGTMQALKSKDFASLNGFVKSALKTVSAQRSALGAVQNRLEHTIKNLNNITENTSAAESAIRDTDMATEMVAFSNNNILAQAGTSMLAQANQGNQNVLSLLG